MRTLATPHVLPSFVRRLRQLTPAHRAIWGTMSAQQMARHLADATDAVLQRRAFASRARGPSRFVKLVALRVLPRMPRGVRSGAEPASVMVDPAGFAADVERAVAGLEELAAAPAAALAARHPIFGAMTQRDWLRWAYLHTDHHLRQFGV